MSTFSAEDIAGREGKQKLADALKDGINETLLVVEGFGGVENVHLHHLYYNKITIGNM